MNTLIKRTGSNHDGHALQQGWFKTINADVFGAPKSSPFTFDVTDRFDVEILVIPSMEGDDEVEMQ